MGVMMMMTVAVAALVVDDDTDDDDDGDDDADDDGGEPHGPMKNGKPTNNRAVREANCPAGKITCDNCGKQGHYKKCCQAKPKAQVQGSGAEVTKEANQPQPNNGQEVTKEAVQLQAIRETPPRQNVQI